MTDYLSKRRGLMLVLSSPSGAGKTTLSRKLLNQDDEVSLSVSATTRPPREGEVDGKDYYFVSEQTFAEMVSNDAFLEYADVFDHKYGTPKEPVVKALEAGKDVLFDIDWQGTQQLVTAAASDIVRIFILPPSLEALEGRLKSRAQDTSEIVQRRMAGAKSEISHWAEYDYVLLNDDLERCYDQLATILKAERLRARRSVGLAEFAKKLQA